MTTEFPELGVPAPFEHHDPDRLLVSVQLMCHDGYRDVLPRAIASIANQTFPHDQLELQVVWDGPPAPDCEATLNDAVRELDFPSWLAYDRIKNGYYCAPRNNAFLELRGYYLAHMDADNEWRPEHLAELVRAIRTPDGERGFPHFTYSRREYVADVPLADLPDGVPVGPSPLIPWTPVMVRAMLTSPLQSFIDTGDFLCARSTLFWVHMHHQFIWNPQVRRFGDWELLCRMARLGLRGRAVDNLSHIYHWTGKNVQITRPHGDIDVVNLKADRLERPA